jgi:O-antigen ligase
MLWLLLGYVFLFIYRPFEVWPLLGECRLELAYMVLASVVWLFSPKRLPMNAIHFAVAAFSSAVLTCCFLSPWSDRCLDAMDSFFKFLVFYLMIVTILQNEDDLQRFLWALVAVMYLYMVHSLWEFAGGRYVFRMGIPRLVGVDTTRSDPNAMAATITFVLIFVPVLWRCSTGRPARVVLASFTCVSVLCILLSGSRSGLVGLLLWVFPVVWRSKRRGLVLASVAAAAPLMFLALPPTLQNRFQTIVNPDVGPKNAQTSVDGRIEGFLVGIQLFQANPIAGVGPGAWRVATKRALESHNLIGQTLGETGLLGTTAFLLLLVVSFYNVWRIRKLYRMYPDWDRDLYYHLSGALGFGLFLLLFKGNFGHNLYNYNWILFAAMLCVVRACVESRAALHYSYSEPVMDPEGTLEPPVEWAGSPC